MAIFQRHRLNAERRRRTCAQHFVTETLLVTSFARAIREPHVAGSLQFQDMVAQPWNYPEAWRILMQQADHPSEQGEAQDGHQMDLASNRMVRFAATFHIVT